MFGHLFMIKTKREGMKGVVETGNDTFYPVCGCPSTSGNILYFVAFTLCLIF